MRLRTVTYLTTIAAVTALVYYVIFLLYQFGPLGGSAFPAVLLGDGVVARIAGIASLAMILRIPRQKWSKQIKKLLTINIVVLAPALIWIVGRFLIGPLRMMG